MSLALTELTGFPMIKPGDNLAAIIFDLCRMNDISIQDDDVFVLAQKVVSKAEGRMVNLSTVTAGEKARELGKVCDKDPRMMELVLQESSEVLRTRPGTIIVQHKLGFVCANAGIDHSNVRGEWGNPEDWVLLLPEQPDRSAREIGEELERLSGKRLGVIIIDSHGRAWRTGTVGTAIGVHRVPAIVDLRGEPDLYGYRLRITQVAAADELAGAASLIMGQGKEGMPVIHVRGFPYPLREDARLEDVIRPKEQDMFR